MIKIQDHAVDRYITRVMMREDLLDLPVMRKMAKRKILDAVEDPEEVYRKEEDLPPVYIKGAVAVPFDYGVIPTAYKSTTFRSKLEDGEQRQRRIPE